MLLIISAMGAACLGRFALVDLISLASHWINTPCSLNLETNIYYTLKEIISMKSRRSRDKCVPARESNGF
jgi:hypothetical protein